MNPFPHPKHEGRPPHPEYGYALSGDAYTYKGVTFRPYRRGIGLYVRISDDFRIELFSDSVVMCRVDGQFLMSAPPPSRRRKRFRYTHTAIDAALKRIAELDAEKAA